uniref:angiotensin-converting enzyme-like isoform X1 n=1 Tax=Styela clava TaxID=7725 RepID=UPI00193AA883|nr:angiotensin-converting enzyme-like isoform X1 [Styela clava]
MKWKIISTLTVVLFLSTKANCDAALDARADQFLEEYSNAAEDQYFVSVTASWNYFTNLTEYNSQIVQEQSLSDANFTLTWGRKAKDEFSEADMNALNDFRRRQLQGIQTLGTANLNEADQIEYNSITSSMDQTYSTSCATLDDGECHPLDPDLTEIMRSSRDYYELKAAWKGWYEASGRPIKDDYERFVELSNQAYASDVDPKSGQRYADTGAYWRSWYETDNFEQVLDALWDELRPMYNELHAYVRRKLYNFYGPDFINLNGPIPAHLFGNMWAQQWGNIYDLAEPYSGKSSVDATPNMLAQDYTALKMFEVSEEFFTSIGLEPMTEKFWNYSMLVKPADGRPVVCHASAWNFYDEDDYRIKQCTVVNMEDLITVHHEMGHIQYYQQYKDQPVPYRSGANPGFHEAVGDTLSLSVSTPAHLQEIQLLDSVDDDPDADINYLLSQALEKIAFLPFGYLIDKWRWGVMDGSTPKSQYQSKWDELRLEYQGIVPPVERSDAIDFDPGAKYHIPGNTPYIRYFVSFVIQFQFYQAMCNEANHQGPLYKCDFYKSKEAGQKLGDMLKLGSSLEWPEAMFQLTGTREMSTLPLQEYFAPLTAWLKEQNEMNGDVLGWAETDWRPKGFKDASGAAAFVDTQNTQAESVFYDAVVAEWNYNTNINEDTQAQSQLKSQAMATFYAEQGVAAKQYDDKEVTDDPTTARLIKKMSDLGTGALPEDKLKELSDVNAAMQTHYSTSTVCGLGGSDTCVPLDPDLTAIMATSRNYNDLRDAWLGWRDAISAGETRQNFERYVELSNEAAVLNNYDDMGAYWRSAYETPNFDEQLEEVWQEVLPLYESLHAYVRRRLYQKYGDTVINLRGPIPAHILGNMWAQDWANIYEIVEPFPGKVRPDATAAMIEQGWNADKMFQVADDFFRDMGLIPVPQEFWDESMLTKPTDGRDVVCHASAWDFYNRKDFRIKMCTTVNQRDFVTIHHELGHIQYFLQYKDQHVMFRDGANPGFHEAVGDTLALSVSTMDHLYKLGLIGEPSDDKETNINYLMSQALDKIAFLPFGYLIDKWRWDVFSQDSAAKNLNQDWWQYRTKYQGVAPPVERAEDDFDPAAKFHVSNNVPYIRYFVSFIVQFQFYKSMCDEAGYVGPLYKCDFNGSVEAGTKLGNMLNLGSSVTWEDALRQVTGSSQMSSAPLMEYFAELKEFLDTENQKFNEVMGWPEFGFIPPENTVVLENGRVIVDDGNGATTTSSNVFVTSLACIIMALLKYITE